MFRKAAGGTRLYIWTSVRLADWAAPAPCPSGRAVKVVIGRAKPDAVIHRNRNNNDHRKKPKYVSTIAHVMSFRAIDVATAEERSWRRMRTREDSVYSNINQTYR